MRKTFQRWLFVFIATAFTIMFLFSLYIQTWQARRNTLELIHLKIGDIQKQIARNDQHIKMLYNFLVERSLVKIYAFAKMVEYNPNLEYDFDELKKVQNILQVDELHISDEKGVLIASTESTYLGYDMNSQDQSRPFVEALVNPDFVLIQDPQPRGINGELFSYAGVARRDKPGILQIGIHPKSLEDAMNIAAIENLAPGFRIGNEGQIIICQDGKIVSIEDEKWLGKNIGEYLNVDPSILEKNFGNFSAKIEGVANIFRFERFHDHVIIGSLPNKEMYFNRRSIGTTLIVAN
ncbi:MAG: cache domain-containing protein, partial [Thermoguttaceae bacterium]|nr:cache domain-containing protein [Thermoguttaceae bacterium]